MKSERVRERILVTAQKAIPINLETCVAANKNKIGIFDPHLRWMPIFPRNSIEWRHDVERFALAGCTFIIPVCIMSERAFAQT